MIATTKIRKRKEPRALYTPQHKEMIRAVKQAICALYDIPEDVLLHDRSFTVAQLRFYSFWILANMAGLRDYVIADVFGYTRRGIAYGIDQIESHRHVYRDVSTALKTITDNANKFPDKKFDWCLQ